MSNTIESLNPDVLEKYNQVRQHNLEQFLLMPQKERNQFKKSLKIDDEEKLDIALKDMFNALTGHPKFEKSALFQRLSNKARPFKLAPPGSFGSSWHELIDIDKKHELVMFNDDLDINKFINKKKIIIHQHEWRVVDIVSDKKALITYPGWDKLGFVWKIELVKYSCKDTKSFICIPADTGKERVTTLDELRQVQLQSVERKYNSVKMALDNSYYENQKAINIEKYGKGFGGTMSQQNLEAGNNILKDRRNNGLSDYPAPDEISKEVELCIQNYYYDRGFSADVDGNLFTLIWTLERLSPEILPENIYL